MLGLDNADKRRGLRSIVMALAVLAMLFFLWQWVPLLAPADLVEVVRGLLILLGIAMLGYQFENALRAFRLSAGKDGLSVEANGEQEQ